MPLPPELTPSSMVSALRSSTSRPTRAAPPAWASADGSSRSSPSRTTSSCTPIGSSKPRRTRGPSGRRSWLERPRLSCTVASATNTEPPVASAHSRLASIAAVPTQSAPSRTMSPLLMPIRSPPLAPPIARRLATTCSSTAASSASKALEKVAITPSPTLLTTVPPDDATTFRDARSNSALSSSAVRPPTRTRHAVEPTTSVNKTVTVSGRTPTVCHDTRPTASADRFATGTRPEHGPPTVRTHRFGFEDCPTIARSNSPLGWIPVCGSSQPTERCPITAPGYPMAPRPRTPAIPVPTMAGTAVPRPTVHRTRRLCCLGAHRRTRADELMDGHHRRRGRSHRGERLRWIRTLPTASGLRPRHDLAGHRLRPSRPMDRRPITPVGMDTGHPRLGLDRCWMAVRHPARCSRRGSRPPGLNTKSKSPYRRLGDAHRDRPPDRTRSQSRARPSALIAVLISQAVAGRAPELSTGGTLAALPTGCRALRVRSGSLAGALARRSSR